MSSTWRRNPSTSSPAPQPAHRLRLAQSVPTPGHYRVEVGLDQQGEAPETAIVAFDFALSDQDREDLRWYLEDYLRNSEDPAPTIAARVEARMRQIGTELFGKLFQEDARDLWVRGLPLLADTRIEIVTSVQEATSIPWELLRDPKADLPLVLRARAFVRSHPQSAQRPALPAPRKKGQPLRILLVICRPGGGEDVPFRSVAGQLLKGLGQEAQAAFHLEVLRPPTFERLSQVLHHAKSQGQPYQVVHFDGHGTYAEQGATLAVRHDTFKGPGKHGYLAFENPALPGNTELIDGTRLGQLLVETGASVLVLNACRSAHAETPHSDLPNQPEQVEAASQSVSSTTGDIHAQVRALGSLAQEVMDAGVAGVVAMRYNVYVVTAAQFVADLYGGLVSGQSLGEAATLGRKQLAAQPLRDIGYARLALQDWPVPVIYEAAPIALFARSAGAPTLDVQLKVDRSHSGRGALDAGLPAPPDAGFFGRDETLLSLDRAFDAERVVLLHAFAGSGKTTAVAEFARWYAQTGGVRGAVLFTSFEQYKPLARVLDALEPHFGPALEQRGIHWSALSEPQRREVALQILAQVPVLWIWDNVEPVAGFPAGTRSAWSQTEQRELVDFLRAAAQTTQAKFLLTSRREERVWLGDLPRRVRLGAMPMQERLQLAQALAGKQGQRIELSMWRGLLAFTEGNPLTITVLVKQALKAGVRTAEQAQELVSKLRSGMVAFDDDVSQGRSRSLGASLQYGFEAAFGPEEQPRLALLALFQGFVDVDALRLMGDTDVRWCLPSVRGVDREAWIRLLDRAAEVGLLSGYGGGYYAIHPALPWFFEGRMARCYPAEGRESGAGGGEAGVPEEANTLERARYAFVNAMGELGNYYQSRYTGGDAEVIGVLKAEESNLLQAQQVARQQGWWNRVVSAMQGLRVLYDHTGRRAEWRALVEEIVPDYLDPRTQGPLPGREDQWALVCQHLMLFAQEDRNWGEAERLQRARVAWRRQQAEAALKLEPQEWDKDQRHEIRHLAGSLQQLGILLREQNNPACLEPLQEALRLFERLGARKDEGDTAFNLGIAYQNVSSLRDLDQAERWYRHDLACMDESDRLGRGRTQIQLGNVALERFRDAREADRPKEELLAHLNTALEAYQQVLNLLPPDALDDLGVAHTQLGTIYSDAGRIDESLSHYRESIRLAEAAGNLYGAALSRFNVALALLQSDRLPDALEYAQAALRNFQSFGERAANEIQKTQQLIQAIRQAG